MLSAASANARGSSWSTDGFVYFAPGAVDGIWRVGENGGEPEQITRPPLADGDANSPIDSHRWPTILPGNRALLYLAGASGDFADAQIELFDMESKKTRVLQTKALFPRYLADGRIAFVHEGSLMTMQFDLDRASWKFVDRRSSVLLDNLGDGLTFELLIGGHVGSDTVQVTFSRGIAKACNKGGGCQ